MYDDGPSQNTPFVNIWKVIHFVMMLHSCLKKYFLYTVKGFNCEKESIWNSTKIHTNNMHITIDNSTSLALTPEQILSFVFFVVLEKEVSQIFFLPWYLLFPWYFLLFALKDRVLIIVKWCTASSAHWGLPGWGGWEVLEGEGGR